MKKYVAFLLSALAVVGLIAGLAWASVDPGSYLGKPGILYGTTANGCRSAIVTDDNEDGTVDIIIFRSVDQSLLEPYDREANVTLGQETGQFWPF